MSKEIIKTRIMEVFHLVHDKNKQQKMDCFFCGYGDPEGRDAHQMTMGVVLIALGVPRGTHKTFVLTEGGWMYSNNLCGWEPGKNPIDPDWEKFADEVASLVT